MCRLCRLCRMCRMYRMSHQRRGLTRWSGRRIARKQLLQRQLQTGVGLVQVDGGERGSKDAVAGLALLL